VLGHVIGGLRDAQLIPVDGALAQIFNYIYTFHMPAFFFLSGLFAYSLDKKTVGSFAKDLALKIYYPCVLWSALQVTAMNMAGSLLNHPQIFDWGQIGSILLGGVSQFWFLKALLLMQIVHYVFAKLADEKYELVFFFLLLGCAAFPIFPSFFTPFAKFGIYYGFGVLFSKASAWKNGTDGLLLMLAALAGTAWFMVSSYDFSWRNLLEIGAPIYISHVPSALLGCVFVFSVARLSFVRSFWPLLYLGRRTMPIFVAHVLVVAGTRIILAKGLGVTDPHLILFVALTLGVVAPSLVYEAAKKLRVNRWLGLG
jgi:fucose 4-O-acetylase-like acetyltransferase